jgi:hypothetical protein
MADGDDDSKLEPGQVHLQMLTKEDIWRGDVGQWADVADDVLTILLDEGKNDPTQTKGALYKLLGNYKFSNEMYEKLKETAERIQNSKQMKMRYHRIQKRHDLAQTAYGWAFFVIFLVYPSVTNKIFTTFTCYVVSDEIAFMESDYNVSCTDSTYKKMKLLAYGLVVLIPLGIPLYFGRLLYQAKPQILQHKGPHHLENLYNDYKPECCMWEIYQMIQKVILVGLLTFINRGSILQVLVGVLVSNTILVFMIRTSPYLDIHTNVLAMMGQTIVVLSYLSALLMRVDLATEAFTVDTVGTILIACNIPMMMYLAWDTWIKMQIKFFEVQIDLLAGELGGVGATYRALHDVDVLERRDASQVIQYINWLGRKKIQAPARTKVGTLRAGTVVTALDQAITRKGVGRILVDGNMIDGNTTKEHVWVKYNVTDGGGASILTGERNLQLLHHVQARKTGRLEIVVRRLASPDTEENTQFESDESPKAKKPGLLLVTVMCCRDLKNMDTVFGKNDVYVSITVNGRDTQRTVTIEDAGSRCKWGKPGVIGETLVFEDVSMLKEMVFHVFDEDDDVDADGNAEKTSELIGLCRLPLEVVNLDLYAELEEGVLDRFDDGVSDALGDATDEEQRNMSASVRDLVATSKEAGGPEAARASDEHAEKKRQKEERLWSKIARDEHGMGTWHWHSTPLLTLREDVDTSSWQEDVEQGENIVTGAVGGFAAMVAKRAAEAVSSKVKAADQKDQQHKDKAHKKKHKKKHKKEKGASKVMEKEAADGMVVPSVSAELSLREEELQHDDNPLFTGTQPPSRSVSPQQGSAEPGGDQPVVVDDADELGRIDAVPGRDPPQPDVEDDV